MWRVQDAPEEARVWMERLGSLLYSVEKVRKTLARAWDLRLE